MVGLAKCCSLCLRLSSAFCMVTLQFSNNEFVESFYIGTRQFFHFCFRRLVYTLSVYAPLSVVVVPLLLHVFGGCIDGIDGLS